MDTDPIAKRPRARTWLMTSAAAAGIAIGAAGIAGAATNDATSTTKASTDTAATAPAPSAGQDPAKLSHGPGETELTGTTAEKVKAAALAAVPGATVIRVETDSDGSPYEAHLTKADGTQVTVKIDSSFKVTATESGFGQGGPGHRPPQASTDA